MAISASKAWNLGRMELDMSCCMARGESVRNAIRVRRDQRHDNDMSEVMQN